MSNVYKGIYLGADRIVKVIKNGDIVWRQSSDTNNGLVYNDLGNGYYKMQTVPGQKYLVTLTDVDPLDIGTKKDGLDIRNSYIPDKSINFTAITEMTYFKVYKRNVKIVSIEEI